MDPMQLFQLQQMMQQRQGMMGGQPTQQPSAAPQLPSFSAAPQQGQLPAPADPSQQRHGLMHGILPYLGMGLLGGSLLSGGGMGGLGALGGFGLAGGLYSLLHGKN